ncbi:MULTISPECIES: 3-carboxyethylcatechol 2,3-dioxygenase [unclassified Mycolicibacterium]|uniref:3-carboxyethylcatechol 2,3-dioxygenase n=1 Tax=unclassified Mycolicibacterium TaxID=2636767 RepID=UPI002EDA3DA4
MTKNVALCCLSHSPLLRRVDPGAGVRAGVDAALAHAKDFAEKFDPDLVVIFGPDHYQGFRYEIMPPFCVGTAARSIGDYDTAAGPLSVPQQLADALIEHLLASDLDVAMSEAMVVDHGIAQPLETLFGGSGVKPVIPIFINSLADPLGPPRRARLLGAAVGSFIRQLDCKVLVMGSGGLSHDPPVPLLRESPPEVAEFLISRRRTEEEQRQREEAVLAAGLNFAAGRTDLRPLNPQFDREFLELLASGDLERFDAFSTAELTARAGHSIHEVRTWVAAHAALAACGPYESTYSFYQPVPEWIIAFSVTTALPLQIG